MDSFARGESSIKNALLSAVADEIEERFDVSVQPEWALIVTQHNAPCSQDSSQVKTELYLTMSVSFFPWKAKECHIFCIAICHVNMSL